MENFGAVENRSNSMEYQRVSFYAVTLIFVLTSNLMLIYGFYKTSRPFTIITKLFIYLSFMDLTFLVISIIIYIFPEDKLNPKLFVALSISLFSSIYLMDMFIFWTISFLRFLSIYKPMYRVKTRKVYNALMVEFLISFLYGVAVFWIYNSISFTKLISINYTVTVTTQLLMNSMNLFLNASSLIILRRSIDSKAQQKGDEVLANEMVIKRKKMALNTLLLITIVQLSCTLPLTLFLFTFRVLLNNQFNVFRFFQCLQISSFGFNSMIVILRTKNLREFYKRKISFPWWNESQENQSVTEISNI